MIAEDKDGISIRCDKCGSRLIIAANARQIAARRMPSGWMRIDEQTHSCPLCSQTALSSFQQRR